jgi:hypothetical protein
MDSLTVEEINFEISYSARLIVFQYCISIVVMTFKRSGDIYFIKKGQSSFKHGVGPTITTLLFGWWGIPWGPIYSLGAIFTNLGGGKDLTQNVMSSFNSK